jgi:Ca2+-binding EF-hand superfamily protein
MTHEDLQQKFNDQDPENTGFISLDSFRRILHDYAKEFKVVLKIQEVSNAQDVLISFEEFQSYMLRNISDTPPVIYHPNGAVNWVSTFEFTENQPHESKEQFIVEEDKDVSQETVIELLRQLDNNENGQVSFAAFLQYHNPEKDAFRTIDIKI